MPLFRKTADRGVVVNEVNVGNDLYVFIASPEEVAKGADYLDKLMKVSVAPLSITFKVRKVEGENWEASVIPPRGVF